MKKSLIALAVAGVVSAPAFAATSNVDVYGIVSMAIEDTDATGVDVAVVDRVSRIGFKGSEDLGGGLKAIWQIEQQINATTGGQVVDPAGSPAYLNSAFGGATQRNTFVGLAGDFGTFLMGRHDTPYKLGTGSLDIFADTIADYNGMLDGVALIDAVHDYRSPQAIAYISPTFSGFHAAIAAVASNNTVAANLTGNLNSGDNFDAVSVTAIYANGPLFGSLSYQDVDLANSKALKLGVGYTFGDTKVGFIYEDVENYVGVTSATGALTTGTADRDSWLLNVTHAMGPIVLKAEYGQADVGTLDQSAWALGVDYNLSKRTTAYAIYTNGDNDTSDDISGFALGLKHSF